MEYLIGVMVLVGLAFVIYFGNVVKGKAIAERDRDDLVDEARRRKETERIDAERDADQASGDPDDLRDRLRRERERMLRESRDREDKPGT